MTEELTKDPTEDERTPRGAEERTEEGSSDEQRDDDEQAEPRDEEYLQDLPDGSGCTEIWEHIAERRADDD